LQASKVLILGETGTGKTLLTAKLAAIAASKLGWENTTIIDMAPIGIPGIGGRITRFLKARKARILTPQKVYAPRLMGRSPSEVRMLAEANRRLIEPLLHCFLERPTLLLVVNDASIYLHAGDPSLLEKCVKKAEFFIGNAYSGSSLSEDKGAGITIRERLLVKRLAIYMDHIIYTSDP